MWATVAVTMKRLFARRWLALVTLLGVTISVALTTSVPLYADAVYSRMLQEEVIDNRRAYPPFALLFVYLGSQSAPLSWDDVQSVDRYLSNGATTGLGLPVNLLVRYAQTDTYFLFAREGSSYQIAESLAVTNFAFQSDLEEHITIVEGRFPQVASPSLDSVVEVLVSDTVAARMGLQVGETYVAFAQRQVGEIEQSVQVPVRIAGTWEERDHREEYWFVNPTASLVDTLLVPEQTFQERIGLHTSEDEVYAALWYVVLDGSDLRVGDVEGFLSKLNAVQKRANALLSGTTLLVSPAQAALDRFQRAANLLTVSLYAFSVPIVGLLLVFIVLVAGLAIERERNEIAMLRSRGASIAQVMGISVLESLLVGGIALAIGLPCATAIARLMSRTYGFMAFGTHPTVQVRLTPAAVLWGVGAALVALLARLLPTFSAARKTIVSYKQESARTSRPPWWQRMWLDVLLSIPAVYGAYQLRRQGSLLLSIAEDESAAGGAFFHNPLLFLVPALCVLALTLLALRVLPLAMAGVSWLVGRTRSVGLLLASRYLARTPGLYTVPLILLVLTLSLSAYVGSVAKTLDRHLYESKYYQVGADVSLEESGEDAREAALHERARRGDTTALTALASLESPGRVASEEGEPEIPRWNMLPSSVHLTVPGVRAASRVGRYAASAQLGGGVQQATFLGIDRLDFPRVAFWRWDFAPRSLGALMNGLALTENGVLVPRDFMRQNGLVIGDVLRAKVSIREQRRTVTFIEVPLDLEIVGSFDLFPTWYPEDKAGDYGPLLVGNLDYLFGQARGQFPYDVWLETLPTVDYDQLADHVEDLGVRLMGWRSPISLVLRELRRPERQGLLGLLSVEFLAAALMTAVGFLLYAFFSFRRRYIEMGVLRALGLTGGHLLAVVLWELTVLVLIGVGLGTALGVGTGVFFIPYLQISADPVARVPPFVIELAWSTILSTYALFGLLFVVALSVLTVLLLRIKVFQAIKLGETV